MIVAPPNFPERQLSALEAIYRRAETYRNSYAGQDYARRRQAALKGRGR